MWYKTKVLPDVANLARDLVVHMSHTGQENWKELGHLIVYIKVKEAKGIILRKPKVLKAVMFCDSNYATDNNTRKIISGFVATLSWTLLTCSFLKTEDRDDNKHRS